VIVKSVNAAEADAGHPKRLRELRKSITERYARKGTTTHGYGGNS
jgi:hypothetical protein